MKTFNQLISWVIMWICITVLLFSAQKAFAQIYKCVDVDGKVSFQSSKCQIADKSYDVKLRKTSESIKIQGAVRKAEIANLNSKLNYRAKKRTDRHYANKEFQRQEARYRKEQRLKEREVIAKEREANAKMREVRELEYRNRNRTYR